jgi:hypothetical protein
VGCARFGRSLIMALLLVEDNTPFLCLFLHWNTTVSKWIEAERVKYLAESFISLAESFIS